MDTEQHRTKILSRTSRTRGVALITTLAGFVVVSMLVLAFLSAQRSQHTLTGLSLNQKACREGIRSVVDFCRFQLEGQAAWGRLAANELLEPVTIRDGTGTVLFDLRPLTESAALAKPEFAGLSGEAYFEGELPGDNVSFHAAITNNLSGKAAHATEPVGPKACLLKIRAARGQITETVEVLLRRAAFFDSSIATSGQIHIDADEIDFASADRLRNQIRSKSQILLPAYQDIKFTPHPAFQSSEKGTVWAAGDIFIARDCSEPMLRLAADHTGGEFLANAPTHYEVPQLRRSDIDSNSSKPVMPLEPGSYLFTEFNVEFLDTAGVTHKQLLTVLAVYDGETVSSFHFCEKDLKIEEEPTPTPAPPPLTPTPSPSGTPLPSPTPPPAPLPRPETVVSGEMAGIVETDHEFFLGGFKMVLSNEGSGAFVLAAEYDYRVAGSLTLGGTNANYPALLAFEDNAPDPDNPEEGSLSVSANLEVGASLLNCGKLVAGRNVLLAPRDVTIEKLEEGNDIAIYAGNDVTIAPMFSGGEAEENTSQRYFVFRGIVYAEQNFQFLSKAIRGEEALEEYNRRLLLEGAVVARQGNVYIKGNEKVKVLYNREFLDDLLEKTVESDQVQVEEMSWRPL
jgi:hypothetical protein